jgi:hypothetical protein
MQAEPHDRSDDMLTTPRRDDLDAVDHALPGWEDGHAAPEDRALGLELELIELVRQRDELLAGHPEVARLDAQISAVQAELVAVASAVADSPPA